MPQKPKTPIKKPSSKTALKQSTSTNSQRWKAKVKPREGEERRSKVVGILAGKVSKEEANYRQSMDEAKNKRSCAECREYELRGSMNSNCMRVAGIVQADDICDLFAPR